MHEAGIAAVQNQGDSQHEDGNIHPGFFFSRPLSLWQVDSLGQGAGAAMESPVHGLKLSPRRFASLA